MTEEDITYYRNSIETQLKDKEVEIDTSITYIIVGLLGLFLTINEKFIPLIDSKYKLLLGLSILNFLISFLLSLANKFLTTYYDRRILDFIDEKDLRIDENEKLLLKKWKKYDSVLQRNKIFLYSCLFIAMIFQFIYLFINLNIPKEDNKIKLEKVKIKNDTILKSNENKIFIIKVKK